MNDLAKWDATHQITHVDGKTIAETMAHQGRYYLESEWYGGFGAMYSAGTASSDVRVYGKWAPDLRATPIEES